MWNGTLIRGGLLYRITSSAFDFASVTMHEQASKICATRSTPASAWNIDVTSIDPKECPDNPPLTD